MSKRILKTLIFDLIITYPAIYFAGFTTEVFQSGADNVVNFLALWTFSVSVMILLNIKTAVETLIEQGDKPRTKFEETWFNLTNFIELCVLIYLGWYWCALSWFMSLIMSSSVQLEMKKILKLNKGSNHE